MHKEEYRFSFEVYHSSNDLLPADANLLEQARAVTNIAYAPYSHFSVGAAALLANGEIVKGTNQENASYPVGICAERALLSAIGTLYPNIPIQTMAISYHNFNQNTNSTHPISPCGMCRQALLEYEGRVQQPVKLILSGLEGEVVIVPQSNLLLPLSFKGEHLKK
ncbi:MAG: cytidine deaminase [Sphingobacteriia bacterium]|nr:cytidine deaminase [Sphingobacteriia bacterium]